MRLSLQQTQNQISKFSGQSVSIDELLVWCSENDCSDLMIKVGTRPYVNRYGAIEQLNTDVISDTEWNFWSNKAISAENNATYVRQKYFDFSYQTGGYRYRVNVSYSQTYNIMTARMIKPQAATFKNGPYSDKNGWLEYPEQVQRVLMKAMSGSYGPGFDKVGNQTSERFNPKENYSQQSGIILFSAPTGQGKSSTMQAAINSWKGENGPLENMNIITLEDPIEAIMVGKESTRIIQKELNSDFIDFPSAISSAMREHAQMILVGETRDKATVKASVDIGRSGHLCVSTFHTASPSATITRLLDNFSDSPMDANDLISQMSLIICQRLDKRPDLSGYDLHVQYLYFDYNLKRYLCEGLNRGENMEIIIEDYMNQHSNDWRICGRI